jgi:hypothetical protein
MKETIINFLLALWHRLIDRFHSFPVYRVEHVGDRPDVLAGGVLYVVGHGEHAWEAAMRCPKGCGRTLSLNLLSSEHPCWKLEEHPDGTATLSPSIWRKQGCGCHFFLRRGRIQWT